MGRYTQAPNTKRYAKRNDQERRRAGDSDLLDAAGNESVIAAFVVADGGLRKGQARELVLRALKTAGMGAPNITRALGRSVEGGVTALLKSMVTEGLLETWDGRINSGRYKWVKWEKRPKVPCYKLTDAGRAELAKLERAQAVAKLAAMRAGKEG